MRQIQLNLSQYTLNFDGWYPYAEGNCKWLDDESPDGWVNKLRLSNGMQKKLLKCPRELKRDFSYSLNCREIQLRRGDFGSWRTTIFARSMTPLSSLVLLEESNDDTFLDGNCDQDNYFKSTTPEDAYRRHGHFVFLFVDGHAQARKNFDKRGMSYFTDRMSVWF
ncbi:MAG: hypothetical protein JXR78_11855, partial [Victivallales bacterium]|nr:hypothetical protein [Victivallales bacterium]